MIGQNRSMGERWASIGTNRASATAPAINARATMQAVAARRGEAFHRSVGENVSRRWNC